MGNLVCIDNHVLIWGISEYATDGQEYMIDRTKRFLNWLDKTKSDILIPSVIVAEFLMTIPPDQHNLIINLLEMHFLVSPFDTQAASYFSRIWQKNKGLGVIEELQQEGRTREALKADIMFVATAIAKGASIIYSQDHNAVPRFAEGFINVSEIPDIPEQQAMF